MMNYALYIQTKEYLSRLSSLTPLLRSTPGLYWQKCIDYLQEIQEFADKYKLHFSSDIALTISKLLTFSDDGQNATAVKRSNRKQKDRFAVNCIEQIHKEIKDSVEKSRNAFDECGNVWRQVLAQTMAKGLLLKMPNDETKLDYVISLIRANPELAPYYTHIIGVLGLFNARAVLDTIMPELNL